MFGGVLVVANLRGGGEFGKSWHDAGKRFNKQNVFDDFAACQEHVVARGYTAPERLVIQGGSNGGLLVATSMNQRPELCGAVLCHVGVLDLLRFQRYTIGAAWVSDYCNADASKDEFVLQLKLSPLHNVPADKPLPACLILTSDHDDRVVPLHSFKFAAELQHTAAGNAKPLLMRVERKGGHGAGLPLRKQLAATADALVFAAQAVGAALNPT